LIFDFDGVVVDSEPIHLAGFQQVLAPLGVELTREAYYTKHLGSDDHDCLADVLADSGVHCSQQQLAELIASKTAIVKRAFAESVMPLDGAVELIRAAAAAGVPLGVCSGALRDEIELASRAIGVLDCFSRIVSAEDVNRGKPDAEGYRLVLERLSEATGRRLKAARCVAVEDSPAGIQSAKGAGMKVLAVTTSYPAEALKDARRIVDSLAQVTVSSLDEML